MDRVRKVSKPLQFTANPCALKLRRLWPAGPTGGLAASSRVCPRSDPDRSPRRGDGRRVPGASSSRRPTPRPSPPGVLGDGRSRADAPVASVPPTQRPGTASMEARSGRLSPGPVPAGPPAARGRIRWSVGGGGANRPGRFAHLLRGRKPDSEPGGRCPERRRGRSRADRRRPVCRGTRGRVVRYGINTSAGRRLPGTCRPPGRAPRRAPPPALPGGAPDRPCPPKTPSPTP